MATESMNIEDFYKQAGLPFPYGYQSELAGKPWPDLLDVPTGMGKTAAVALAWLWKRGWRTGTRAQAPETDTPRRLVWCLPMRVLVEQTADSIQDWLRNLGILGEVGESKVSIHVLMAGESGLKTWAEHPEEDMILIGTQDMLLSRALMRGYGMSRYQWPIQFSLLHNDCLWVYDEVQLMGAGLATSAQLEAFRRGFPLAENSRSLWVSATLNRDWLATVDMRLHCNSLSAHTISGQDREQAGGRLNATKELACSALVLTKNANNQAGEKAYTESLSQLVLEEHDQGAQTLVIVNRVERAQQLFRALCRQRPSKTDLLVHGRFRAAERGEQSRRLRDGPGKDRIVVATQAIEAGVDISSKTLITELAPWPSMVQRFGRCNRYGEYKADGGRILWLNIDEDADTLPYTVKELTKARNKLSGLDSASPGDLPSTEEARPLTAVLRRRDLLDLFNTDPDLSGFDVDVSDYIRDSGTPGVQVFWREFEDDPNQSGPDGKPENKPHRCEICPISMSQAKGIEKRGAWYWDTLGDSKRSGQWAKLTRNPRPGMTLLLRAADGGYDKAIGFDSAQKKPPVKVIAKGQSSAEETFASDYWTQIGRWVPLQEHLTDTARFALDLCRQLGANGELTYCITRAARWHDLGKAHEAFQCALKRVKATPDTTAVWAKSDGSGRLVYRMCYQENEPERRFFRHELASMLGWLAQHDGEPNADLIAYLILAHHGKVRMSLRAMPGEEAEEGIKRFARGVWEGDRLPALDFDGEHSAETTLKLALMEIGEGEQGPSWAERALKLLDQYGPFQLAWLETLVRLADWRASAAERN
jgi:CRISPR-associated endonuclease/helicase Cas3